MGLNTSAWQLCQQLVQRANEWRVSVLQDESGATLIDCGVQATGGLAAGVCMAEVCMAGLGDVCLLPTSDSLPSSLAIQVVTDQPVAACMASQYAGWPIQHDQYFAMGSGPMRAARGKEKLFDRIGYIESPGRVVGVLESGTLPSPSVCEEVAEACSVQTKELTLLVAPTSSIAGTIQVVARSVETALHKLFELDFDLTRIISAQGVAPLPPVAAEDLVGIGRTNDAVMYGSRVTLWAVGDADSLERIGPRIPSSASPDHGRPFAEIFAHYEHDFYRIDPMLFSPAVVELVHLDSGRRHCFGELMPDLLLRSFSS